MKKGRWALVVAMLVLVLFPVSALAEPIVVNWWHAHGGRLGEKVNAIAEGFNGQQNDFKVNVVNLRDWFVTSEIFSDRYPMLSWVSAPRPYGFNSSA